MNRLVRSTAILAFAVTVGVVGAGRVAGQSNVVYSITPAPVLSEAAEAYVEPIRNILDLELRSHGYQPLDFWLPDESAPLPVVVDVTFGVVSATPRLHVFVRMVDTERDVVVATISGRLTENVSLFNDVADLVERIEPYLARHLATVSGRPDPIAPPMIASGVTFLSTQPVVMRNRITGMVLVTSEETGSPEIDFVENVILPVEISAPGFLPRQAEIAVASEEPIQVPELIPAPRWAVQVHTSLGRLAGIGAGGRYFVPGTRWHLTQELDAFATIVPGAPHFLYHVEPRSLVGVTAVDRRRLVVAAGTGIGAVVTRRSARAALTYLDLYWNLFFVEAGYRIGSYVPFVRTGMSYAFEMPRGFYRRGIGTPYTNPNVVLGVARRW